MTPFRSVTASVLFVLFLSVGSLNAAGGRGGGSTQGTFVAIKHGANLYFVIKEKNGEEDRYAIVRPDESVKPYLANPAKFKGHPVTVTWYKKVSEDGPSLRLVSVE